LRDNGDWNGEISFKKLVMYRFTSDGEDAAIASQESSKALVLQREAA
jgi:hypothetical protein